MVTMPSSSVVGHFCDKFKSYDMNSEISGQEVSEANTEQQYLHPLNEILITLNRSIGYAYRSIDYV